MEELKKCPFCGGEIKMKVDELDAFRNVYSFLCKDCDMEIIYPYSNEEEAIKTFNTRKPMERIVERLEEKVEITWKHDYMGGRKDAFVEALEIVRSEM